MHDTAASIRFFARMINESGVSGYAKLNNFSKGDESCGPVTSAPAYLIGDAAIPW
jgi:hypothetical protein